MRAAGEYKELSRLHLSFLMLAVGEHKELLRLQLSVCMRAAGEYKEPSPFYGSDTRSYIASRSEGAGNPASCNYPSRPVARFRSYNGFLASLLLPARNGGFDGFKWRPRRNRLTDHDC